MKEPVISKKQDRFLSEFLNTKTLMKLMPYFVTAVSKSRDIYPLFPASLITKLKEKLDRNIFEQRTRNDTPQIFKYFVNYFGAAWRIYPYALVELNPKVMFFQMILITSKVLLFKHQNSTELF